MALQGHVYKRYIEIIRLRSRDIKSQAEEIAFSYGVDLNIFSADSSFFLPGVLARVGTKRTDYNLRYPTDVWWILFP